MHKINENIHFTPSDLTLYMESPFASWIEHLEATTPELVPEADKQNTMMSLLQKKGNAHELEILNKLQSEQFNIVNLSKSTHPIEDTLNAIRQGADIIYQATLEKFPFQGRADFLIKVEGKSLLGHYHYEPWDTKLSKSIKPNSIIQLCCYADMLEAIQGYRPENMAVVLGNQIQEKLKVDHYYHYYQQLKSSFLSAHQHFNKEQQPDPSDSTHWGRWENYAQQLLLEADHLSQIATIKRSQIKKLNQVGIKTMQGLIDINTPHVSGMHDNEIQRLKAQAAIQKQSIGLEKPLFTILKPELNQKMGLALLPPHSPLDIFFDIEGFPLVEGGLEYLWGCTYFDAHSNRQYCEFWAHNREQEKNAFKEFITWAYSRWQQDPSMHIYHYAAYEISACRKLMGRYGICEYEVDQLLRNEVFVDLYKVVKGGILLGEPKYSIKNVEHLYRGKRETYVGSGSDSVVVYENWQENPDGDIWQTSTILNSIRDYNIDDCNSTQELADWLRARQEEHHIVYLGKTETVEPDVTEEVTERTQLRDHLLKRSSQVTEAAAITLNFAWSLEFHRRENKPVFWRLFDRLGMESHELLDDFDCLAHCTRTDKQPFKPTAKARNLAYEYQFDPSQAFKGTSEDYYILGEETSDGKKSKVSLIKDASYFERGIIAVQTKEEPPPVMTLLPDEYVNPDPIPAAIYTQAKNFSEDTLGECAILDFLTRSMPRIHGHPSGQPIAPSQNTDERMQQIIKAAQQLDNSYLVIQGPPGAGKTYTAKHIIAELLKQGKKIGICSNSHKAINNLLISTAKYCSEIDVNASFICTKETESNLDSLGIKVLKNNQLAAEISTKCVIGTTAWGFSRDDLVDAFDYLFIDEAGQVSVANLIAISRCAKNIIMMGDQMQLGQPSQGSHPAESGLSILDYLLHDNPTIPEELGVFLGTTYRMHSAVNQFISAAIYNNKLTVASDNDKQIIQVPKGYSGIINKEAGIIYVPVDHEGNTQASEEEVLIIKKLAHELLKRIFINKNGEQRCIDWSDILFVAPYNHQVNKLREALGVQAQVGSVDKFQGQEAPIVFLSMCASNATESPRGLDFLFDKHRLNVAISRAQSLAIVVASPLLRQASVTTVEQLASVNVYCQLTHQLA